MVVIFMKLNRSSIYLQTHFFQAYDSVSYIRTVERNTCHVAFIIGKSRLALLITKGIFIELLAAVISVRVKLIQECNLKVSKILF